MVSIPLVDHSIDISSINITLLPGRLFNMVLTIDQPNSLLGFVCHREILMARSHFFQTTLTANPSSTIFHIGALEREAVLTLLKYFYSGRIDLEPDHCIQSLLLACRWTLTGLSGVTYRYIMLRLQCRTALDYLCQYVTITSDDIESYPQLRIIRENCLSIIDQYGVSALLRPSLYKCDTRILTWIVKRGSLRINEWTLFTTLLQWVEERCRANNAVLCLFTFRTFLGPVFNFIRFPLMRVPELVTIKRSGLAFKQREYDELLSYLLDNPRPIIPFSSEPRADLGFVAQRFRSSKMVKITSCPQEIHQIDLIVDCRVRFIGMGIFTPNFHHLSIGKTLISLQLWHVDGGERLFSVTRRMIHGSLSDQSIYPIIFTSCIHLLPKVRYSLIMVLRHTNWRNNIRELAVISGIGGLPNIMVKIDEKNIVTWKVKNPRRRLEPFNNFKNGSSVKKGQFHSFIFDLFYGIILTISLKFWYLVFFWK